MDILFSGEHRFPVDKRSLWDHLNDPGVLAACLPGCTGMTKVAEDVYEADLKLQVASVGGTFSGRISLTDKLEPEKCRLTVQGSGTIGHATGHASFELQEISESETRMTYQGTGEVGGLVAGVGQRVLGGVTKYLTKRFLSSLEKYAAGETSPPSGKQPAPRS